MKNSKTSTNPNANALRPQRLRHSLQHTSCSPKCFKRGTLKGQQAADAAKPQDSQSKNWSKKKVIANIGFKEWKKTSCISLFFLYTPVYVQAQQLAEAFVSTGRGKKASGSTSHWNTRTLWCTKLAEKTSLEIAGKEAVFCSVSLLSTETRL